MDAISASLSGLRTATTKFNRASEKLVQSTSGVGNADPAQAIVEQIEAGVQFKASAKTLRAADQMMPTLLDITI